MRVRPAVVFALALAAGPGAALLGIGPAQAQSDLYARARAQKANRLGMFENCQSQGFVGPDVVAAARRHAAEVPAGPAGASNAGDEALGRSGTVIMASGRKMTMAAEAGRSNETVAAMCQKQGQAELGIADGSRGSGAGPGAVPGAAPGTVPGIGKSLRSMPSMPAVPGMPALPGIPR